MSSSTLFSSPGNALHTVHDRTSPPPSPSLPPLRSLTASKHPSYRPADISRRISLDLTSPDRSSIAPTARRCFTSPNVHENPKTDYRDEKTANNSNRNPQTSKSSLPTPAKSRVSRPPLSSSSKSFLKYPSSPGAFATTTTTPLPRTGKPDSAMLDSRNSTSTATPTPASTNSWSTTNWLEGLKPTSNTSPQPRQLLRTSTEPLSSRSPKPLRSFRPSPKRRSPVKSQEDSIMADQSDITIKGLQGHNQQRSSSDDQQHHSDDSDIFLKVAREEDKRQTPQVALGRSDSRKSRIAQRPAQRHSFTPSSNPTLPPAPPPATRQRHASGSEGQFLARPADDPESLAQALDYQSPKDRAPTAMNDRFRFYGSPRSTPSAPRTMTSQEASSESSRRAPIQEFALPPRTSYRQSNLSYGSPRSYNFNSSPSAQKAGEIPVPETPKAAGSTESTVSTTAPSTVWDELDDLKSRIHRLELTGKLPTSSGAAVSRVFSGDRPVTATTTATGVSASPKRGEENGLSSSQHGAEFSFSRPDTHPLLQEALVKSRHYMHPDIHKALQAATADALAIAAMMGSSGQPGPISSSQSTVGGSSGVSDRQVRRKADSMCRSLTELVLVLSENPQQADQHVSQSQARGNTQDPEIRQSIEEERSPRPLPRTLDRPNELPRIMTSLEQRRSSLLSSSALPSPRYAPSIDVGAPIYTATPTTGRRTSMFLRSRRVGTDELQEEDEVRFRAPSRANTEIGRLRNTPRSSPRNYLTQSPVIEQRGPTQSSLPVRRQYGSSSASNSPATAQPPVSTRRFLERTTPERDTASVVGRLVDERGQRKSSGERGVPMARTSSLNPRNRQSSNMDQS